MEFGTIDSARRERPEGHDVHFQGQVRLQRFASPFGERPAVLAVHFDVITVERDEWHWHGGTPESSMTHVTVQVSAAGDIDWDVDEGDWANDY